MSLVIALLIAAVGVLWYSLNTAETFANRSRTDIALGKYEILRDRSGASGDTAFFKKHSNINGFRTPEQ